MRLAKRYETKTEIYGQQINHYVAKYVESGTRILDVGCGIGKLGEHLGKYAGCSVAGVDISKVAIGQAAEVLDEAFCLDVQKDKLPFADESFDVIICADVLEHLFDPLEVLRTLKAYLRHQGYFLLCIPNVANIKIRCNLLLGKFDYKETGILDNTHVRFFTRKTVQDLVSDAGLSIKQIDYMPGFSFLLLQDQYVEKLELLRRIRYCLMRLWPTLFCNRFVIVAEKK